MNVIRNGPPRRARLAAVGAYAPDRVVTNAELERTVDTSEEWIVARTGIARSVLVVGSEVLSRITDPADRATRVLFADGAGGALVTAADPDAITGFLAFDLGADGSGWDALILPAGGGRRPVRAGPEPHEGLHPGDLLLLVGFEGGLTSASTVVRYEPVGVAA